MESNNSDQAAGESNSKRPNVQIAASTSTKPDGDDYCPILTLPPDILAKIIVDIPVAQWPALESLDTRFRDATLIAWRQLRRIDLERELLIKSECNDRSSSQFWRWVNSGPFESILQKLVDCSPFLNSLSSRLPDGELYPDVVHLLAQFERLESIFLCCSRIGVYDDDDERRQRGMELDEVAEFLESTPSRTSLKELRLNNVVQRRGYRPIILDLFASSFVHGREIQSPLKFEKFSFTTRDTSLRIRLDTLDTTRLIDVRLGKAWIEPYQLSNLIERASSLRQVEFSFLSCGPRDNCDGPRHQANKNLLSALASRENLTAIKFGWDGDEDCNCENLMHEFIEMLETIGRRGQLRKLSLDPYFLSVEENMEEIYTTIRNYIPYLRSISIKIYHESGFIVDMFDRLTKLEEVRFSDYQYYGPEVNDSLKKIAQLPHLERLALRLLFVDDQGPIELECLANATKLTDLRIESDQPVNADVLEKWSNGFGSNLRCLMLREVLGGWKGIFDAIGLVRLLEKAVRLRVLILDVCFSDELLSTIAQSCPQLEILGVRSASNEISVQYLQEVVDHCPKLKLLGGISDEIRKKLQLPKYRKIGDVDMRYWFFHDVEFE